MEGLTFFFACALAIIFPAADFFALLAFGLLKILAAVLFFVGFLLLAMDKYMWLSDKSATGIPMTNADYKNIIFKLIGLGDGVKGGSLFAVLGRPFASSRAFSNQNARDGVLVTMLRLKKT